MRVYARQDGLSTYSLRFRAYGKRRVIRLGTELDGWTLQRAEVELATILEKVEAGIWRPPDVAASSRFGPTTTFHEYASRWAHLRSTKQKPRTQEAIRWALTKHLLPFFSDHALQDIDYDAIERYAEKKLADRAEIELSRAAGITLYSRMGRPRRSLSNRSINATLGVLRSVLQHAFKHGVIPGNPAADPDLRLDPEPRSKGNYLEADELADLIQAAGELDQRMKASTLHRGQEARQLRAQGLTWKQIAAELGLASDSSAIWLAHQPARRNPERLVRRAIVATLACSGIRNTELCQLRMKDINLANGRLAVLDAKTEAGIRDVIMSPRLREELGTYRASIKEEVDPNAPAFPTRTGRFRDKDNINQRVIKPAVKRANELRASRDQPALPPSVSAHTLRRTYITLMLEAGAPVPYVLDQVGHRDERTTMRIYAQVLKRRDRQKVGAAFDELMSGVTEHPAQGLLFSAGDKFPPSVAGR